MGWHKFQLKRYAEPRLVHQIARLELVEQPHPAAPLGSLPAKDQKKTSSVKQERVVGCRCRVRSGLT